MTRPCWWPRLALACVAALSLAALAPRTAHADEVIVDNADPEFTVVSGSWITGSNTGQYGADLAYIAAGSGASFVRFTPDLPTATTYAVFARWTEYPNRATNAPFTVHFASGASETVRVNQEADGAQWNLLGTFHFEAGTAGSVTLSDDANEYVIADAVRWVPVAAPTSLALLSAAAVNITTVDLAFSGALEPASANLAANYAIPGLSVASAARGADGRTVRLTTSNHALATTYTASSANVQDLSGNTVDTPNGASYSLDSIEIVVDNAEAGFSVISGSWSTGSNAGQLGADLAYIVAGTGASVVRFTPNFPFAATYAVYARWTEYPNRATNAPYTVHFASGASETVRVNQEVLGAQWNLLGTFPFEAGTGGFVTLSDDANEYVIADAVRWVPVAPPTSLELLSAAAVNITTVDLIFSGALDATSAELASSYSIPGLTIASAARQADGKTVRLTTSNHAISTTYTASVEGVQDLSGNTVATPNGASYNLDSIEIIVDNADGGFSVISGAWSVGSNPGQQGPDLAYIAAGTGASVVRFTPILPFAATYAVYARWTEYPNRATNAPFMIHFASGASETVRVDQEVLGAQWNLLGTFPFEAGDAGAVELSDDANEYVIADAVKWVPVAVTQPAEPPEVVEVNPVDLTVGAPRDQPATVRFSTEMSAATIDDLSCMIVDVASGQAVPATVSYDPVSRTARIIPRTLLTSHGSYSIRVTTAVQDVHGVSLESEFASAFGTGDDIALVDTDGDGLADVAESIQGTSPTLADSDGDGLQDGVEVLSLDTDPRDADSDVDGASDGEEVALGTNPLDSESGGVPGFDGVPPRVVSVTPADASSNISVGTHFTIAFSEPVSRTEILSGDAITLEDVTHVPPLRLSYGTPAFSEGDSVVEISTASLPEAASVRVSFARDANAIRDASGNANKLSGAEAVTVKTVGAQDPFPLPPAPSGETSFTTARPIAPSYDREIVYMAVGSIVRTYVRHNGPNPLVSVRPNPHLKVLSFEPFPDAQFRHRVYLLAIAPGQALVEIDSISGAAVDRAGVVAHIYEPGLDVYGSSSEGGVVSIVAGEYFGAAVSSLYLGTPSLIVQEATGRAQFTVTRQGQFAPKLSGILTSHTGFSARLDAPGVYTVSVTGGPAGAGTFSKDFIVVGKTKTIGDGACLMAGDSSTMGAHLTDAQERFSYADLEPPEWSTDDRLLTFSPGTGQVTEATALPTGQPYSVNTTAVPKWPSPIGDRSMAIEDPQITCRISPAISGVGGVSDVDSLSIAPVPSGTPALFMEPGTTASFESFAHLVAGGAPMPIGAVWHLDADGEVTSWPFLDPSVFTNDASPDTLDTSRGPSVQVFAGFPLGRRDDVVLRASLGCSIETEVPIRICYDIADFEVLPDPTSVTAGQSVQLVARAPDGRELSARWKIESPRGGPKAAGHIDESSGAFTAPTHPVVGTLTVEVPVCADGPGSIVKTFTLWPNNTDPDSVKPPHSDLITEEDPDFDCTKPLVANIKPAGAVFGHSGEEHQTIVDLFVRGRGDIDFALTREYRARARPVSGPFGIGGWDFNYNERLIFETNGDVVLANGLGRTDTYVVGPDGRYVAPAGFFRVLLRELDGSFVQRERDGFKRRFDSAGRLTSREDRHGNRLSFTYDANGRLEHAVDPFGRTYSFHWQEDGKLGSVSDFAGRTVRYEYDHREDLRAVISPVVLGTSTGNEFSEGRTTRYEYHHDTNDEVIQHNIYRVIAPVDAATWGESGLELHYGSNPEDPLTYDRVIVATVGGDDLTGFTGGSWVFTYEMADPGAPPTVESPEGTKWLTTVHDPDGNVSVKAMDEKGRLLVDTKRTRGLRAGEPSEFCLRFEYDDDNRVIRTTDALGGVTEYEYDGSASRLAAGNLLEKRRYPDARGGGAPLITRFTYEPLNNRPAATIDPRGAYPSYEPPSGGPASEERYTTRLLYDYQEGTQPVPEAEAFGIDLSGVERGLGDLNGDGVTSAAFGDLVLTRAPSVNLLPGSNEALARGGTVQAIETQMVWGEVGELRSIVDAEGNLTTFEYHPQEDPDGDGALVPGAETVTASVGYLKRTTQDAGPTPRRRATAPPAQISTHVRYDALGRPIEVVNARGIVTAMEWNALGEMVSTTRDASGLAYVSRSHYDANGRVIRSEVENRDGNAPELGTFIEHTFQYDILDRLVSESSMVAAGVALTSGYAYTPNGRLAGTTRPEGNVAAFEFDERDLLFKATRGAGTSDASTVQRNYDANGNLLEVLDAEHLGPDGSPARTTFEYDGFNRLVRTIDALGNRVELTYDPVSQVVREQVYGHPPGDPEGAVVLLADRRLLRDELSRVYQTDAGLFVPSGSTPERAPELNEGALTPGDGFVTTRIERDALSRVTYTIDDDGRTRSTTYDGASRVIATLDPLGNRTEIDYDPASNPVRARSFEVSPEELVPEETFETIYVYDALDRLVRVTDDAGQTATFAYDSRGLRIRATDPHGPPVADPLGLYTRADINAAGNSTQYFHDGLGRLVKSVIDLRAGGTGAGAVTDTIEQRFEYDGNSRLTARIDGNDHATRFEYDALDRVTREVYADDTARTTVYDRNDNALASQDANGTIVQRTYDVLNRLTDVSITYGAGVTGTSEQHFEYDGASRLTRARDILPGGTTAETTRVYDSLSRQIEEVQDGLAVSSAYAGVGRRTALTYGSGRRLDFTHDENHRLKSISDGTPLAAWDWIGPGMRPLQRTTRPSSGAAVSQRFFDPTSHVDTGWDAAQRLIRMTYRDAGGQVIADLGYAYDRAGNRTQETRHEESRKDAYTYDSAYRIASASYGLPTGGGASASPLAVLAEAFSFDLVGNRIALAQDLPDVAQPTRTIDYATNAVNQYTNVSGTAQVHDAAGNLTSDGRFAYVYDFRNLVVEMREIATAKIVHYRYDALGRRIEKRFTEAFAAADGSEGEHEEASVLAADPVGQERVRRFVHDGAQTIEERRGDGSLIREWVYGVGIDEPLEIVRHADGVAESFHYVANAIGSVVALTDAAGAVVERYRYEAFGREVVLAADGVTTRTASVVGNPIRFQGRWRDLQEGSPLVYFRARMYDPGTGRFLQRDPVWDAGNLGNQRAFVGNGPIDRRDPLGLEEEEGGFLSRVWGSVRAIGNGVGSGLGSGLESTVGSRLGLPNYDAELQRQYNPLQRAARQGGAVEVATNISLGVATGVATVAGGAVVVQAAAPLVGALIPAEVAVPGSLILASPFVQSTAQFTGNALAAGGAVLAGTSAVADGMRGDWQGVGENAVYAVLGMLGVSPARRTCPIGIAPKVTPQGPPKPPLGSMDDVPPGWRDSWEWRPGSEGEAGTKAGFRWWDEAGGEWRRHAPDKWHNTQHWDHNPWRTYNDRWLNIDDAGRLIP